MPSTCWICEKNIADSGEHIIKKSTLNYILGKPAISSRRYIKRFGSKKSIGVGSFKGNRFKFKKSICKHCNNTLTQPYDDAFDIFIKNIFKSQRNIVSRQLINIRSMCGNNEIQNNLSLYLYKIFGCMIIEHGFKINTNDFFALRESLLTGVAKPANIYLSVHRDLKKLSVKNGTLVAQLPTFSGMFTTWTIDLDWFSMILSYPSDPPLKYGQSWLLSQPCARLKLGKLH